MGAEIIFRGRSADAKREIGNFVALLTGKGPDRSGAARSVFFVMGLSMLSEIQQDFIRKSRGETGEDGVKWPPLSKEYLAYGRRFGKGEQSALKKDAGLGRAHRHGVGGKGGLLTKAQKDRWNQVYARSLAWMAARYGIEEARGMAAGHAWNVIKREGAKTKLEVYGNRQVDMLRDTGILLNSLSPGYLSTDGSYSPPAKEGGDQQILKAISNGIVLGTAVPYAGRQNKKRPFLPSDIPKAWQERMEKATRMAIIQAIYRFFMGGQAA